MNGNEAGVRSEEDERLIASLMEDAKIDVNEFFAAGGTAADFEAILSSARTPLELAISRLTEEDATVGPYRYIRSHPCAMKSLNPVEQDRHLYLVRGRTGIPLGALRTQLKGIPGDASPRATVKVLPPHTSRSFSESPSAAASQNHTDDTFGTASEPTDNTSPRPSIYINDRQLRDVVEDFWAAVHRANKPDGGIFQKTPHVFLRGDHMVYLVEKDSINEMRQMSEPAVYGLTARVADSIKVTETKYGNVLPLKEVARDMMAYPSNELPQLDAVIRTPVFGHDGTLIIMPGYNEEHHVWMDLDSKLHLDSLSGTPTPAEIQAARDFLLDEVLVDFPFKDLSDRAHAIAAMIIAVC